MSKKLKKLWTDQNYSRHVQMLSNIRANGATVDNKTPDYFWHGEVSRSNKLKHEFDGHKKVFEENLRLLNRLEAIMTKSSKLQNQDYYNKYSQKSLNIGYRVAEQDDIARKNQRIAKRLDKVKPVIDIKQMERDNERHEKVLAMRAKDRDFPEHNPVLQKKGISPSTTPRKTGDDESETGHDNRPIANGIERDCRIIHGLLADWPKSEDRLAAVLSHYVYSPVGPPLLDDLVLSYKQHYDKADLFEELVHKLGDEYVDVLSAVFFQKGEYQAFRFHTRKENMENVDFHLALLVCTSSPSDLNAFRHAYKKMYKEIFDEVVLENVTGSFNDFLFAAVSRGLSGLNKSADVSMGQVKYDAKELRKAVQAAKKDKNFDILSRSESVLQELVFRRSSQHLNFVLDEYTKLYAQDFLEELSHYVSTDFYEPLTAIIRCAANSTKYISDHLAAAFKSNDVATVIDILMTRNKESIKEIQKVFRAETGRSIEQTVKSLQTPNRKFLLAILKRRL